MPKETLVHWDARMVRGLQKQLDAERLRNRKLNAKVRELQEENKALRAKARGDA